MRVLYLTSDRIGESSAAAIHIAGTTEAMVKLGHRVGLVHATPRLGLKTELPWLQSGWSIWWPPVRGGARIHIALMRRLLPRICKRYRPDVLYLRHRPDARLGLTLRNINIPKVLEVNGPAETNGTEHEDFFEAMDLILADTEDLANQLKKRWPAYASCVRSHLSHVVDADYFRPEERQTARSLVGLTPTSRVLVYVSGFEANHDFDTLLDAIRQLAKKIPSFVAVFVGNGPRFEEVKASSADLVSTGKLVLVGRVDRAAVRAYICAADVCADALTSVCLRAGNVRSMKMYEYMACAKPTVVTVDRNFMVPPWADRLLFLVEAENSSAVAAAIASVFDDPLRAVDKAEMAREYVKTYRSWEAATKSTMAHLEDLVGTYKPRSDAA